MPKIYIWYSPSTSVTGRRLAQRLGLSRRSPSSFDREYGTRIPPTGTTHVVCWGGREPIRWKDYRERNLRKRKVLNNPFKTELFKDKLKALERMEEAEVSIPLLYTPPPQNYIMGGVVTPELHQRHLEELRSQVNNQFPIVGRKKYHWGGSGFNFIRNVEQLIDDHQSDYWLEYIDGEDKREYRVHVFKGEVIRVQRKREKEGFENRPLHNECRSHKNGWYFSLCDRDRVHPTIMEEAVKAVSSLRYDFGAVDVIRVPGQDRTVVLEVNSGVGLDDSSIEIYVDKIREWIEVD